MARILYVWKSSFPWDVRVEKFCDSLANFGNSVVLLARWGNENLQIEKFGKFLIHRVGFNLNRNLFKPFPSNPYWKISLKSAIAQYQPDLIVVREFFLVDLVRKAIGVRNIPLIFDMAEHYPEAMRLWRKYNSNFFRRFLMHKVRLPDIYERKAVLASDAIITVCLEQKQRLIQQYNFPESKIEIVHNTPKLEWFEKVQKKINIPPMTLGYHGYLTLDKPIQKFVKYFADLVNKESTYKLLIAGDGEFFEELKKIALRCEKPNSIILKGEYSFDKLAEFLNAIDIGVVPYQRNGFVDHTLTNKLFDYLAAGRPVIVSNSPPMARIISETNAGMLVDIEDENGTKELLQNLDKFDWKEMSKNAYYWAVEKYNWEVDSHRLWNFLQKYL